MFKTGLEYWPEERIPNRWWGNGNSHKKGGKHMKVTLAGHSRWVGCGGLNRHGPNRFICLNTWPWGVSLLGDVAFWRRCVLRGSVLCYEGRALRLYVFRVHQCDNLLHAPEDPDVELSALSPAPCLSAPCHASCHDKGLCLWNYKSTPIKCPL